MRYLATLLLLGLGCGAPSRGDDTDNGQPDACDGLECRRVNCAAKGLNPTSISGTVFAPNGTLALYGASVYIPLSDPGVITPGASCSRCQPLAGGSLVNVLSDPAGHFTLDNVPVGRNVPIVIQIGKWRRQVSVPEVLECQDNPLPANLTSLPKSRDEGDMPRIAMVTGSCDAIECLIKKLGVSPSEFTIPSGPGRIHMYAANGANKLVNNDAFGTAVSLWGDLDKLKQYDIVMNSCECSTNASVKTQQMMDNMKAYADFGGRLFLSHYHHIWISGERNVPTHAPAVWPGVATCQLDDSGPTSATIDQVSNPKGAAFASWMVNVMGSSVMGSLSVTESRASCTRIDLTKAEQWAYYGGSPAIPAMFQFTTPNEMPKDDRCGRVVFSDMHVSSSGGTSSPSTPFPQGCSATTLNGQEKALAFMFFDIASCVGPIF